MSNKNNRRFLALDFDGVLVDSIQECLVVGNNAYAAYSGKGAKILSVDELSHAMLQKSRHLRNYIRSGEDYVYIFHALHKKIELKDQIDFDAFLMANTELRTVFFNLFYLERQSLLIRERRLWLNLNPIYPGIPMLLYAYAKQDRLAIVSTKKSSYIIEILQHNGIEVAPKWIFHAHEEYSKRDIISDLLQQKKLAPCEIHFIDDQVSNLLAVQPLGVECFLAAWGYNDDKQRQTAARQKLPILTFQEFLQNY